MTEGLYCAASSHLVGGFPGSRIGSLTGPTMHDWSFRTFLHAIFQTIFALKTLYSMVTFVGHVECRGGYTIFSRQMISQWCRRWYRKLQRIWPMLTQKSMELKPTIKADWRWSNRLAIVASEVWGLSSKLPVTLAVDDNPPSPRLFYQIQSAEELCRSVALQVSGSRPILLQVFETTMSTSSITLMCMHAKNK